MEQCANTQVLDRYLSGEEQFEKICERFEADVLGMVQDIRRMALDYEGYDFRDNLREIIRDIIDEEIF